MMEKREGFDEKPRSGKFEGFLDFRPGEFGRRETTDDLTASLQEIQKMDAVLKIKVTEEKRAKLSRIQTEEESRDILSKLPSSGMPDRIKINLEKFMKLLNDVAKAEASTAPHVKSNEEEEVERDEPTTDKEEEAEKGEKTFPRGQNANSLGFVERNIKLAKCGRGTLSLTDEERSRIDNLLEEVGDSESKPNAKGTKETCESYFEKDQELYAMDKHTRATLTEIDRRLELLTNSKTTKRMKGEKKEKSDAEEMEKERGSREKMERKKVDRLEEINKLLNAMNLASNEEIRPMSEQEIESLVRRSKESLAQEESAEGPPPTVMTELVSDAKFLMPKFRYRFEESQRKQPPS